MCFLWKLYPAEKVANSEAGVMCSCKCFKLPVLTMLPDIVGIEEIAVSKVTKAS